MKLKKAVLLAFILVLSSVSTFLGTLKPVEADWTWTETIYIKANGSVEPDTAPVTTIDNITYTLADNIVSNISDFSSAIVIERDNIIVDGAGYTLQGPGPISRDGIFLSGRSNVTIRNIEISKFNIGIRLYQSSNNTINGNNIKDNDDGVRILRSNSNILSGNNIIENNYEGIYLGESSNNCISGNAIIASGYNGIVFIDMCSENKISGNIIINNRDNIYIADGSNNTIISGNIIRNSSSGGWGILLSFSSNNKIYENNTIENNFEGISLTGSSNNTIYHNNFINNTMHVHGSMLNNTWDNGFEGNYWSDYNGTDSDNDGIGNTPYIIGANNIDNYPLMGMFSDFEATTEHHVQIICNSTVSDFLFEYFTPSEIRVISFDVRGEDGTAGFCRICIPRALMNEPYTVLVNATEVSYNLLPFSNETHSYLYFTYSHSTQEVIIIPEFSSWISILLILTLLTVALVFYKRRLLKTPNH